MSKGKLVTKALALLWLLCLCTYSSILIGTLGHELMHKHYSIETKAISVNYDTTGVAQGKFYPHSHEYVYLQGFILETCLFLVTTISFLMLIYK